jgi:cytochrome c-type biogenesis protein
LTGNFTSLNQFFIKFGFFEPFVSVEQNLLNNVDSMYGPLIAATAGVLSFFSPCVLPLIPVYFINLTGDMLANLKLENKFSPVSHALFFVGGFTIIFVALGTTAGILGGFFIDNLKIINQISGVVVFVLGMQMTGLIKIPFLDRTFNLS